MMESCPCALPCGGFRDSQWRVSATWERHRRNAKVCKQRARGRAGHETLSPEKADEVVDAFCRGLRPPERSGQEPYDAVHVVASDDDAEVLMRRAPHRSRSGVCAT